MTIAKNSQFIFEIPLHWTAEQAEAIFDLLHQLAKTIFDAYENEMMQTIQNELAISMHESNAECDEIENDDDYIPF